MCVLPYPLFLYQTKMKKITLLFILGIFMSVAGYAQKVKFDVKDDTVSIEKKAYCILQRINRGFGLFDYSFKDLQGTEIAYVSVRQYTNPARPEANKTTGVVYYYEYNFLSLGLQAEVQNPFPPAIKGIAKHIVTHNMIKDGAVDEAAIKRFCQINGTRYTEDQKRIGIMIHR